MKMMRSKLYEYELDKKKAISRKLEDSKLDIKFGSQIRSYVLQPYRMAKDLRTRVEVGDVDKVLDGDLEPFIRGYLRMRREQRQLPTRTSMLSFQIFAYTIFMTPPHAIRLLTRSSVFSSLADKPCFPTTNARQNTPDTSAPPASKYGRSVGAYGLPFLRSQSSLPKSLPLDPKRHWSASNRHRSE
jgi:hypothetical protein